MDEQVSERAIGKRERTATRLIFLLCGTGQSAWAPLVPFAKARVHANDQQFGVLLLCFGIGSIVCMPVIGMLASRFGCKLLIQLAAVALCTALCALPIASTFLSLALALIFFGACIGSLDVAMNLQAVLVERAGTQSLMPGFHALYSVGGIAGALLTSALIWFGLSPRSTVWLIVAVLAALLLAARSALLPYGDPHPQQKSRFRLPGKTVLILGSVAFVFMLAEGAMLDWSAIFLTDTVGMLAKGAGIGYAAFSIAMTASRFGGHVLIARLGRARVIVIGASLAAAGFLLAVAIPHPIAAIAAFALVGIGAANLVPLLFSLAAEAGGNLGNNISFVTTLGYSGVLTGPAMIGFVVHRAGFAVAFCALAVLLLAGAACAGTATRRDPLNV